MGQSRLYRNLDAEVRRRYGVSLPKYVIGRLNAEPDLTVEALSQHLDLDKQRLYDWLKLWGYRCARGPRLVPVKPVA